MLYQQFIVHDRNMLLQNLNMSKLNFELQEYCINTKFHSALNHHKYNISVLNTNFGPNYKIY